MNYFDFYKLILETIERNKPTDGQQLQSQLSQLPKVQQSIKSDEDGVILGRQFQETLNNLIEDGLVNGNPVFTKSGNLFVIHGLSTTGHQYLVEINDPKFSEKLISVLKEEGIPLTPSTITRAIAKLIW